MAAAKIADVEYEVLDISDTELEANRIARRSSASSGNMPLTVLPPRAIIMLTTGRLDSWCRMPRIS